MQGRCCCSEMMTIRDDWKKLEYCLMTSCLSCKDLFACFVCLAASDLLIRMLGQLLLAVFCGLSLGFLVWRFSPVCLLPQIGLFCL
jgi:hypothetical protein